MFADFIPDDSNEFLRHVLSSPSFSPVVLSIADSLTKNLAFEQYGLIAWDNCSRYPAAARGSPIRHWRKWRWRRWRWRRPRSWTAL